MKVPELIDKAEMARDLGSLKLVKRLLYHWVKPVIQGKGRRKTMVAREDFHRAKLLIGHGILPAGLPSDGTPPGPTGWPILDHALQARIDRQIKQTASVRLNAAAVGAPCEGKYPKPINGQPKVQWLLEAAACAPIVPISIEKLRVDPERFQWKTVTDAGRGTNDDDHLGGAFSPTLAGIITVYEESEGLYILDGHHRLALAHRTGAGWLFIRSVPSTAITETDAFVLGVMLNISDGHGTIRDQIRALQRVTKLGYGTYRDLAYYLQNRGAPALALCSEGCPEVIDAVANNIISASKALAIVRGAPDNRSLQRVGIREATAYPSLTPRVLQLHLSQLAKQVNGPKQWAEEQGLWEPDDTVIQESRRLAERVDQLNREIDSRLRAVRGAASAPDTASTLGVLVPAPERTHAGIQELQALKGRLEHWKTSRGVIGEVERSLCR